MKLKYLSKDPNWRERLEKLGYGYHSDGNIPYWIDDYYLSITNKEADAIYQVSAELWEMCLQAVDHVITNHLYDLFKIPVSIRYHIEKSWHNDVPSIYGRFDFALDQKSGNYKLLEFNADTPTSLFECGSVQWFWKNHYFSEETDQYNSIHEQLIDSWKNLKPYLKGDILYFTCVKESLEDLTNVEYLRDTAIQAGIQTELIFIDELGWNGESFVDTQERTILSIFKLYPWEWMVNEEFGNYIMHDINEAQWIEPSWKMILSNKAILPILWKLFPNHPNLLECYFDSPKNLLDYVRKPLLSREGANITLYKKHATTHQTSGDYGAEGYIYQALAELPLHATGYQIIGSWIIGQEPCGISFRESDSPITTDKSRFIPHIIEN